MEWFSARNRRAAYASGHLIGHTLFIFLLPLIVYFNRTYTGMHLWCGLVAATSLLTWRVIPESFRWLVSQGRWSEASAIMMEIGRVNGRILKRCSEESRISGNDETDNLVCQDMLRREYRS